MGLPRRLRRIRKPSQKQFVFEVNKATSPKNTSLLSKGTTIPDQVKSFDVSKSSKIIGSKDESIHDVNVAPSRKNTCTSKTHQDKNNEHGSQNSTSNLQSSKANIYHGESAIYINQSNYKLRSLKNIPTTSRVTQTPSQVNTSPKTSLISSFFEKKTSSSPSKRNNSVSPKSKIISSEISFNPPKPGTPTKTKLTSFQNQSKIVENLNSEPFMKVVSSNTSGSELLQLVETPPKKTPVKSLQISSKESLSKDSSLRIKNTKIALKKISQNKDSNWHVKNGKSPLKKTSHYDSSDSECFGSPDNSQPTKQTKSIPNSPIHSPVKLPTKISPKLLPSFQLVNSSSEKRQLLRKKHSLAKNGDKSDTSHASFPIFQTNTLKTKPVAADTVQNKSESKFKGITEMQAKKKYDSSDDVAQNKIDDNDEIKLKISNEITKMPVRKKLFLNEDVLPNGDLDLTNLKGINESDDQIKLNKPKLIMKTQASKKRSLNEDVFKNGCNDKEFNLVTKSKRIKITPPKKKKKPRRTVNLTKKRRKLDATSDLEAILEVMSNVKDKMTDNFNDEMNEILEIYYILIQSEMIKSIDNVEKYNNNEENIKRLVKENKLMDLEIQNIRANLLLQREIEIENRIKKAQNDRDLIGDFLKTF